MSEVIPPSLERAKSELLFSNNTTDVEQGLVSISEASANLELRPFLQDESLFERLLEIYATTYATKEPPRELLRSIGNLVSDNETNRSILIGRSDCVENLKSLLLNYTTERSSTHLEDFAIKIFFNLCNDSPETEQRAFTEYIHAPLVRYLHTRTWSEEDEALLSVSTHLLASVLEHKNSVRPSESYTTDYIENVLTLPLLQYLDTDAFLDVLSAVCFYLQDENFLLETVQNKQIHLVWNILELTEDVKRRESSDDAETDEDDQKQYQHFLNAFAQCLADLSSLPAFNEEYTVENDFIKSLGEKCIPSQDQGQHPSLAPGCACLVLGNLAISNEVSTALAEGVVKIDKLIKHLGTSNDGVFLNAAAGLLRHLAVPLKNREAFFGRPEYIRDIAHLYTDVSLEQVQVGGLQLTRQIITGIPDRAQCLIEQEGTVDSPTLKTFLTLFTQTTTTSTKLEIARLITAILRSLQSPSNPGAYTSSLTTMVNTPTILTPLIFAIKQAPAAGVLHAQADSWLALNLFVRAPGGAAMLATETSQDEEMLTLLRQRIAKAGDGVVATNTTTVEGEADAAVQPQDARPEWLREKERDNAVVLVYDLIHAEGVSDEVKEGLRMLLKESDIRVRT